MTGTERAFDAGNLSGQVRAVRRKTRFRRARIFRQVMIPFRERDSGFLCGVLRVTPPQQEHHRLRQRLTDAQNLSRDGLPSPVGVTSGASGAYCQGGVEEQDALRGPWGQIGACRHGTAQVRRQFLEDVPQRRRNLATGIRGESETIGDAGRMIGVLTEYHAPDIIGRRKSQGAENLTLRREHVFSGVTTFGGALR